MHPRRLCIVICVLAAFAAPAATVYKWTDADGVVHFSDQPVPGAEKIVTDGSATNSYHGTNAAAQRQGQPAGKPAKAVLFSIASPTPEQSYFNEEVVTASVVLQPVMTPDQYITWHLNGAPLDEAADALRITLSGLERGTYAIDATLTDRVTGETLSTDSVTFYVKEPSLLSPQHRH